MTPRLVYDGECGFCRYTVDYAHAITGDDVEYVPYQHETYRHIRRHDPHGNAGLPPEVVDGLSGQSARLGAVQDMMASGIKMPAILKAGRWKTTVMVTRYGNRCSRGAAATNARAPSEKPPPVVPT